MLIDTFLYSEPMENHLLWLKMYHESPYVDEFIIQENAYDFKGEYKGLFAEQTMSEDKFSEFRHKTKIISANNQFNPNDKRENINFEREKWQRSLCLEYIFNKYQDTNTGIIVSDTDEFFDFRSDWRLEKFKELWNKNIRWYQRRRYWYQMNNLCKLPSIRIPVMTLQDIKNKPNLIAECRHFHQDNLTYTNWENPIAFELSYVFHQWEDIRQKHKTYAHNDLDAEEDVKEGLRLNAWIRSKKRNESRSEYDFFEIIELNDQIAPKYIVDNLDKINTNIIDQNYKENRKNWKSGFTDYGQ